MPLTDCPTPTSKLPVSWKPLLLFDGSVLLVGHVPSLQPRKVYGKASFPATCCRDPKAERMGRPEWDWEREGTTISKGGTQRSSDTRSRCTFGRAGETYIPICENRVYCHFYLISSFTKLRHYILGGGVREDKLYIQYAVNITTGSRLNLTSHMGCNCPSMINS